MPTPTSLSTSIVQGATGAIANTNILHGAVNSLTMIPSSTKTANYTLVLADSGEVVEFNSATALTCTVPLNSAVAFPVGTVISVSQYGVGQVTITGTTGVTLRTAATLTTRAQYSEVVLRKRATNEWVVTGDLT